jgi:3-oxoacyl-(acyl-carrier-protein) synthase
MSGAREVVITGVGVCCNLGDDLGAMLDILRHGKNIGAFTPWEAAERYAARCRIIGAYSGDVSDAALEIGKKESRFMGRAARMALKAARIAMAQAGVERAGLAVVVGSGTGDVETHVEIREKLEATHDCKRIGPTTIPRLMASTVSANLVNVLRTTGPSFSATAACAGGNYNLLLASSLIASGHVDRALAGGVECTDIHFHAGFDAMGAYNGRDNDHPSRASMPYAADRAGFIFGEGAGILVLETRASAEARGRPSSAECSATGCRPMAKGRWSRRRRPALAPRSRWLSATRTSRPKTSTTSTPTGPPRPSATSPR